MSKEQSSKPTLIDTVITAAQDGAVYGLSALGVTPVTIALQNTKVAIQSHGISHKEAVTSLYKEGGKARFFNGFVPYTGRNMGVSAFGGLALEAAKSQTKDLGYGEGTTAALNAALAGAAETIATGYMEGAELQQTKNLTFPPVGRLGKLLSSVAHTAYHTAKISPLLYGRNAFYWGGAVATDYYADKHDLPLEQRATLGTATGFVTGVASTPFDVAATAAFAEKSIKNKVKEIVDAGPKAAFRGTVLRGAQMGAFTAATAVAIEANKQLKQSGASR